MPKRPDKNDLTRFAEKAGISVGYAHDVTNGRTKPAPKMAAQIFLRTKRKFGVLETANDRDAHAFVRIFVNAGELAA